MKPLVLIAAVGVALLARDARGIRPRSGGADYPAHESAAGITVAAAVIPPDEVRHMFATDLNAGFIVMEVAVYPGNAPEVDLSAADFALKIGASQTLLRPVNGRAIAAILQRTNSPRQPTRASDVTLYPTAGIGYESGGYDPVTGRRRTGGVYTESGVGVGIGASGAPPPDPHPASTDRDRLTMQQELDDKALPEGKATQPVAGYLYFPRPAGKQRNALYEITYYGVSGKLRLAVPPPK